jgi:hypothetical protein
VNQHEKGYCSSNTAHPRINSKTATITTVLRTFFLDPKLHCFSSSLQTSTELGFLVICKRALVEFDTVRCPSLTSIYIRNAQATNRFLNSTGVESHVGIDAAANLHERSLCCGTVPVTPKARDAAAGKDVQVREVVSKLVWRDLQSCMSKTSRLDLAETAAGLLGLVFHQKRQWSCRSNGCCQYARQALVARFTKSEGA